MPKLIRPTLTPDEIAQLDKTVAQLEEIREVVQQMVEECRANGWHTFASLNEYQPNEIHGSDWGHWFYTHTVYDENHVEIGEIGYDGAGPRVSGPQVSKFVWEPRLNAEGIDTTNSIWD